MNSQAESGSICVRSDLIRYSDYCFSRSLGSLNKICTVKELVGVSCVVGNGKDNSVIIYKFPFV